MCLVKSALWTTSWRQQKFSGQSQLRVSANFSQPLQPCFLHDLCFNPLLCWTRKFGVSPTTNEPIIVRFLLSSVPQNSLCLHEQNTTGLLFRQWLSLTPSFQSWLPARCTIFWTLYYSCFSACRCHPNWVLQSRAWGAPVSVSKPLLHKLKKLVWIDYLFWNWKTRLCWALVSVFKNHLEPMWYVSTGFLYMLLMTG